MKIDVAKNIALVREKMQQAEKEFNRVAGSVRLLAVSKTHSAEMIRAAYQAGQMCFGENYLQEAITKIEQLKDLNIEWHFIGHIQSNKTRLIAQHFNWVQSVCDLRIAQRLNDQRDSSLPPLNICIEVNLDNESNKAGVAPNEALALAQQIQAFKHVRLRGLMAIPKHRDDFNEQRKAFHKLKLLFDELNHHNMQLDTLSMGMSDDFPAAIAEGATIIRIGTAIFGARE